MHSKHDLQGRIRRLEQLLAGLNTELVRMAMEQEPLTREEASAYLDAIADMAATAKDAIKALRPAVGRLAREVELPGVIR